MTVWVLCRQLFWVFFFFLCWKIYIYAEFWLYSGGIERPYNTSTHTICTNGWNPRRKGWCNLGQFTLQLNVAWILRIWKTCNQFVNPFAVCNRQYLHSSQMKLHAIWQLSYLSEKNCIVPPLSNGLNFLFCAHVALLKRHYQQPKTPPPFSLHKFFDLWSAFKGKEKEGFTEELT